MKINVSEIEMFVEVHGFGRPLIFVHGNGEDHHIFDELVSRLKNDFTCYMIDSRNHGLSSMTDDFSYETMATDIKHVIDHYHLEKPGLIGFSDGGIIGLIMGMRYPNLLSKIMVLGANIHTHGVHKRIRDDMDKVYQQTKNPYIKMMMDGPHYKYSDLHHINIPVMVIAGEYDVIHLAHTKAIHRHIKGSILMIFKEKNHDDYVVHRDDLYRCVKSFFKN